MSPSNTSERLMKNEKMRAYLRLSVDVTTERLHRREGFLENGSADR